MVTEQASNGTRVKSAAARLPGLDGVRALAVIAVIAFHEQLSVLPGGFLGVDPAQIFPAVGVLAAAAVTFTAGYGVLHARVAVTPTGPPLAHHLRPVS